MSASAPARASIVTPAQASAVAIAQARVGARRSTIHSSAPARAGAEPRATIVPTATPVSATAAKNESW